MSRAIALFLSLLALCGLLSKFATAQERHIWYLPLVIKSGAPANAPVPTPSASPTATQSNGPGGGTGTGTVPGSSATPINTNTTGSEASATPTSTSSTGSGASATPTSTNTTGSEASATPTPTSTLIPSATNIATSRATVVGTPTETATVTVTATGTATDTATATNTPTDTATATGTATVTNTPTATATATNTPTATSNPIDTFTEVAWITGTSQMARYPISTTEVHGISVGGKIYGFSGFDRNNGYRPFANAYVYNPATNTWGAIASMPPMNGSTLTSWPIVTTTVYYGGATHMGMDTDGTSIYVAGGYPSNTSGTGQRFGTRDVWRYDIATNTYTRLPDLPATRAAGVLALVGRTLHFIGGTNIARTVDEATHYALSLDNLATGWKTLAQMPNPRQHAASVVYQGKIYIIGGQKGHDGQLIPQDDVHVYDPATNTWAQLADIPNSNPAVDGTGRNHSGSATFLLGNRIIVVAGQTTHEHPIADVTAYDVATNTWTQLTPLPEARHSGIGAVVNGTLYYTSGLFRTGGIKGSPILRSMT